MSEIANQAEVRRFRMKAFEQRGCIGYWKNEYALLPLNELVEAVRVLARENTQDKVTRQLLNVVNSLLKNGF